MSRVITSNNLKVKEDMLQNQEKSEKNVHERDVDVFEFNPEIGTQWKVWLLYFEVCSNDNKKDNIWKIWNIQKFDK